jgi:hypothetical protein
MTLHAIFPFGSLTRREWLRIGGVGMGALLPSWFTSHAAERPRTYGAAKSVIILYLHGGHAQQETWDPKPNGPLPERGEFGAIATSVPGVHVSEMLPRSAKFVHRLAILRSLSHGNANHVQAALPAMTGHSHPPEAEAKDDFPSSPTDFPPFGAVYSALRPAPRLPTWVQVGPLMRRNNGTVLHGQSAGFLGNRYGPFVIDQDLRPTDVRVGATSPAAGVTPSRLAERRSLLEQLDAQRQVLDGVADVSGFNAYQERVLNLLTSTTTARAFDLAAEPASVRE